MKCSCLILALVTVLFGPDLGARNSDNRQVPRTPFGQPDFAGPVYEYGCHEGNDRMPGILLGGQIQAAEAR